MRAVRSLWLLNIKLNVTWGRLLPEEEKVPVTEQIEKDVKVPVKVVCKEVDVVTCRH